MHVSQYSKLYFYWEVQVTRSVKVKLIIYIDAFIELNGIAEISQINTTDSTVDDKRN